MRVEILFHDTPLPTVIEDAFVVVHGSSAVTVHTPNYISTYPWCNVHLMKQYPPEETEG